MEHIVCSACENPEHEVVTIPDENWPNPYCLGCFELALIIVAAHRGGRIDAKGNPIDPETGTFFDSSD